MYKTKDKEGKEKRRREEAGGAGEVLIGRGFYFIFYLILTLVVALQPCRSSS